jgi:hypothetical protein
MRFNIRIDAIWRAPLLVVGATAQNCYVILGDDGMHFRFGWGFNRTVPYEQVAAIFPRSWPILYGVGVRSNLRGVIGLTGSFHDVVEVRLKKRAGNWAVIYPVDRIAVSLEEPEEFIAELSLRTGLAEPPDINALTKPTRRPTKPSASSTNGQTAGPADKRTTAVGATGRSPKPAPTARKPAPKKRPAAAGPRQNGVHPKPPTGAKAQGAGATPRKAAKKATSAAAKVNGTRARAASAPAKASKTVAKKATKVAPKVNGPKAASKKRPAATAKANGAKAPARKPVARKRPKAAAARTPARPRRSRSS